MCTTKLLCENRILFKYHRLFFFLNLHPYKLEYHHKQFDSSSLLVNYLRHRLIRAQFKVMISDKKYVSLFNEIL